MYFHNMKFLDSKNHRRFIISIQVLTENVFLQVEENDTLNSLYKRFLYPEGVKGMVRLDL